MSKAKEILGQAAEQRKQQDSEAASAAAEAARRRRLLEAWELFRGSSPNSVAFCEECGIDELELTKGTPAPFYGWFAARALTLGKVLREDDWLPTLAALPTNGERPVAIELLQKAAEGKTAAVRTLRKQIDAAPRAMAERILSLVLAELCGEVLGFQKVEEKRPCFDRDHEWLRLYELAGSETYHRPAKIRDLNNAGTPEGEWVDVDTVKKGIRKARKERDG